MDNFKSPDPLPLKVMFMGRGGGGGGGLSVWVTEKFTKMPQHCYY